MSEYIYLRPATLDDAKLFFDWVNEPAVRQNSFNTADIAWEEHLSWFQGALDNNNIRIFVLMVDDTPVGQIRLVNSGQWQISYSIAYAYRGHGYGKLMLKLAEKELISAGYMGEELLAEVKTDNIASRRIFTGLGYIEKMSKHNNAYAYIKVVGAKIKEQADGIN